MHAALYDFFFIIHPLSIFCFTLRRPSTITYEPSDTSKCQISAMVSVGTSFRLTLWHVLVLLDFLFQADRW
jgi:hypothetical protein